MMVNLLMYHAGMMNAIKKKMNLLYGMNVLEKTIFFFAVKLEMTFFWLLFVEIRGKFE